MRKHPGRISPPSVPPVSQGGSRRRPSIPTVKQGGSEFSEQGGAFQSGGVLDLEPLPMQEAIAFWRDKVMMSPKAFNLLPDEAKLRGFAVSGIAKGAELETVFASLQKALDSGISYGDFKRDCAAIFDKRGWTGKRAWRVDNIFRTNIQTAYSVGRYKQLMAKADKFYGEYDAVNDSHTRPTHAALDGMIFPLDHPFWDTWWPGKEYRCRCSVNPVHKYVVEEEGLTVQTKDPTNTLVTPIDPTTGNPLPPVQLIPTPGFAYHPGKSAWGGLTPGPGEGEVAPLVSKVFCGKGVKFSESSSCKPLLAEIEGRHIKPYSGRDLLPTGLAPERYVKSFLKEFGIDDLGGEKLITLPGDSGRVLPVNKGLFIDRRTGDWKVEKEGRERYVKLLAQTIQSPYEAWLVPAEVSGRVRAVINLIRLFSDGAGKIGGFAVWSLAGDQWLATTAFTPKLGAQEKYLLEYLEGQRVGKLLYREP